MTGEVRSGCRVLSEAEALQALVNAGNAFIAMCDCVGKSRELSLAKTNAEQAVMWALKHAIPKGD